MPPPRIVAPTEAFDLVTHKLRLPPARRVAVDQALGCRLAEPIALRPAADGGPGGSREPYRATRDGCAVPPGTSPGDVLDVARDLSARSPWPVRPPPPGAAYRVECGAPLGAGVEAVVPSDGFTLVGSGQVRIEHVPSRHAGMAAVDVKEGPKFDAGTRIDGRLQAMLLESGRNEVSVHRVPHVGVVTVGDEMVDLSAPPQIGQRPDSTGYWIPLVLAAMGHPVSPMGILGDDPGEIEEALLRFRRRKVDVVVTIGGLGDGLSDRVAEALHSLPSHVLFERVDLDGCRHVLYAHLWGYELVGLGGLPLEAAAGFDLFARPLLRARAGASCAGRGWPQRPALADGDAPRAPSSRTSWTLWAARPCPPPGARSVPEPLTVDVWAPESPFLPVASGATGWAIEPPAGAPGPRRVLFEPL